MSNIEKIKLYYDKKIYKEKHIRAFVVSGVITAEQYKEITGEDYR